MANWREVVRDFVAVLKVTAVSATLSLVGAFAVAYPAQSLEALRVVTEDASGSPPSYREMVWVFAAALFCGGLAWYWARVLVRVLLPKPNDSTLRRFLASQLPRIWGIVPPVGLAIGFFRAASAPGQMGFSWSGVGALVLAAAMYAAFILRRKLLDRRKSASKTVAVATPSSPVRVRQLPRETIIVLMITSAFWLLAFITVATSYGQGVAMLGPIGILLISLGTWIPAVSSLYYFGRVWRFPTVSTCLVAASVFSCLNLNDNHVIRTQAVRNGGKLPPYFRESFAAWLAARADRANYSEYPVFLVAAEGGGLRAAYFTSLVLSAIQDRCPLFAQHLFAISAVSGGSVGASVFAAEAAQWAKNLPAQACVATASTTGPFQRTADSVLARDFLTPLFAAGLYTDMVQRFLPFRVGVFDRARALETGFEKSWKDVVKNDQFSQSFNSLWPDFTHQATPSLFLNTTRVETGERMVVSNLYPFDSRFNRLISLADLDSAIDIRLSTGATLSARFPLVTPVGGIRVRDSTYRYVDGGYFDNTGITTLAEMLSTLRVGEPGGNPGGPPFRVMVIRIGFDVKPSDTRIRKKRDASVQFRTGVTSNGFNEVMSPVRTLLNSRGAREVNTVRRLRTAISTLQENGHDVQLVEFQLLQERVPLVLGWLMSNRARKEMSRQFGPPRTCTPGEAIENDCSFGLVVKELITDKK